MKTYLVEYKNSSTGIPTTPWKNDKFFDDYDSAKSRALYIQPVVGGRVRIKELIHTETVVWDFFPQSVCEVTK